MGRTFLILDFDLLGATNGLRTKTYSLPVGKLHSSAWLLENLLDWELNEAAQAAGVATGVISPLTEKEPGQTLVVRERAE